MNCQITVEDVFRYLEFIESKVEEQLSVRQDKQTEELLIRLKTLLKENHVRIFIDGLSKHKVVIPACHKIEEIDNSLDELTFRRVGFLSPEEFLVKEERKKNRAHQMTLMILLLGLFGFEWVME